MFHAAMLTSYILLRVIVYRMGGGEVRQWRKYLLCNCLYCCFSNANAHMCQRVPRAMLKEVWSFYQERAECILMRVLTKTDTDNGNVKSGLHRC